MHRPVLVTHSSFIEGLHTTKNTASAHFYYLQYWTKRGQHWKVNNEYLFSTEKVVPLDYLFNDTLYVFLACVKYVLGHLLSGSTNLAKLSTVFYWVLCRLFYIVNDAEIFTAHYTWKVAEKGFKKVFMMSKLAIINSFEINLEKQKIFFLPKIIVIRCALYLYVNYTR